MEKFTKLAEGRYEFVIDSVRVSIVRIPRNGRKITDYRKITIEEPYILFLWDIARDGGKLFFRILLRITH